MINHVIYALAIVMWAATAIALIRVLLPSRRRAIVPLPPRCPWCPLDASEGATIADCTCTEPCDEIWCKPRVAGRAS